MQVAGYHSLSESKWQQTRDRVWLQPQWRTVRLRLRPCVSATTPPLRHCYNFGTQHLAGVRCKQNHGLHMHLSRTAQYQRCRPDRAASTFNTPPRCGRRVGFSWLSKGTDGRRPPFRAGRPLVMLSSGLPSLLLLGMCGECTFASRADLETSRLLTM